MKNENEIEERFNKNLADIKAVYEVFSISPKYVERTSFHIDSISLDFKRGEAIEIMYVKLDHDGFIVVRLGVWCALTPKAKERIEARKFDSAREALVYALETVEKINSFFNQF